MSMYAPDILRVCWPLANLYKNDFTEQNSRGVARDTRRRAAVRHYVCTHTCGSARSNSQQSRARKRSHDAMMKGKGRVRLGA